ncbi:MAG TPA: DUF2272 domain-containing protein [Dongiaceae bacterium]|nr:DUF2272 domain-containing protein [Dongiaceae bacterium]
MSEFTDAVVRICGEELATFQNGQLTESDLAVFQRVGDYWNKLAEQPDFRVWKGYNGRSDCELDASGKVIENKNQPWSAAFISYIAAAAGAGANFHYGSSHSVYIVDALREAKKPFSTAKFVARRHAEYTPKVGDLIACERRKDTDANFDTYIDFVKAGRFEAHCDFVVEIDQQKKNAITIGGNVGNSVSQKAWPLNVAGHIGDHDPNSPVASVICVIECLL